MARKPDKKSKKAPSTIGVTNRDREGHTERETERCTNIERCSYTVFGFTFFEVIRGDDFIFLLTAAVTNNDAD